MNMLTEQQIRQVFFRSEPIPIRELMELCMNPISGITIDMLRKVGYPKIIQLEELYRENLLEDLKKNPSNYNRERMYDIISNNMLSREDLVYNHCILTERAYYHIIRYPHLKDEQRELSLPCVKKPYSERGNIDVYFCGVSGSGKTCILAGMMSLAGQHGFRIAPRGSRDGGTYAMELCNYTRTSMLPPASAPQTIQVIDVKVDDDNGCEQKISMIEMTEKKILEDLKAGSSGLLSNDNKKVFFFVIDLTKEKLVETDEGIARCVNQRDGVDKVVNLLSENESIMKKIIDIHFILSKSDTLGEHADENTIRELLIAQGYIALLSRIKRLCERYYINNSTGFQVCLYPFNIGKFMAGEVYSFDGTDSLKILRLLSSYGPPHPPPGLLGNFINWLNS